MKNIKCRDRRRPTLHGAVQADFAPALTGPELPKAADPDASDGLSSREVEEFAVSCNPIHEPCERLHPKA